MCGASRAVVPVLTVASSHVSLLVSAHLLRFKAAVERAQWRPMAGGEFMNLCGRNSELSRADATNVRRMLEVWNGFILHLIPALCSEPGHCSLCSGQGARHGYSDFNFAAFSRRLRPGAGVPEIDLKLPNDWMMLFSDRALRALPAIQNSRLDCARWTAARDTDRLVNGLHNTALGISACPHRYVNFGYSIRTGERPLHHVMMGLLDAGMSSVEINDHSIDVACAVKKAAVGVCASPGSLNELVSILFYGVTVTPSVSSEYMEQNVSYKFELAADAGASPAPLNIGGIEGLRGVPAARLAELARRAERKREREQGYDEVMAEATCFLRRLRLGLPTWHADGHTACCKVNFRPEFCKGGGTRPERAEQVFSAMSRVAPIAHNMAPHQYRTFWSQFFALNNFVLDELAPFHLVQELLRAWDAVAAAHMKVRAALAAATPPLAREPEAANLATMHEALVKREAELAVARRSGAVGAHIRAAAAAGHVAA